MKNEIKTVPDQRNQKKKKCVIIERVAAVIRDNGLIRPGDRILVAVSGGPDSLALLHLLRDIDIPMQLLAAYIDHGLRPPEIPEELRTLTTCCRALGIPFFSRSVDVHGLLAREKRSPEEAARILRYQALEDLRREQRADAIATGHTADDRVEGFLLRLIRGSSRRGLAGMALQRGKIIRPLLRESKDALLQYLAALPVSWCLDSSNLERRFLRNRVRLDLLPLLEEYNPAIRRTILQNMDILTEEDAYLMEKTEEAAKRCLAPVNPGAPDSSGRFAVVAEPFLSQHPAIRRRILEGCFLRMGIRPTYGQIDMLTELLAGGDGSREIHLDDGVRVEKRENRLLFSRPLETGRKRGSRTVLPTIELRVEEPGRYTFPEIGRQLVLQEGEVPAGIPADPAELVVDRDKVVFPLTLRSARPGETFHPCNGPGRKKINRFFNDRKIPAHERPAWPVLASGEAIVALPGLQIDHAFRLTPATRSALTISWRRVD